MIQTMLGLRTGNNGPDSRPPSCSSSNLSRPQSGANSAFSSRPSSRGDTRPTSDVLQVEGDGGFDSRPPSRGDTRGGGAQGRPLSGIHHVFGDGGFDSRPSSRGDVRPSSRPMSGIIKEPRAETDMLAPGGRKSRLKSASRVTFPEAPGAVQIQVTACSSQIVQVCITSSTALPQS